jgi:hypothetical protein
MPDPLSHQVRQETLLVDQMSAVTDVLMQQEARDLLREPEWKMQPELLMHRDKTKNRGDWLV